MQIKPVVVVVVVVVVAVAVRESHLETQIRKLRLENRA